MLKNNKLTYWIDLLIILAAGALSICLHYEGWRGRDMLHVDMIPYYVGGEEFITEGKVMEKGELSSYNSYNPPGTFYLILPGMLMHLDPRLQDLPGTALIIFGTLIFLYLAIREAAGRTAALAATLVYALTRLGFMGLWPIGHPFFLTAALFFLLLWIKRRAAWALGAALAVLAFGLYVDLAILPIVLVIPALWLIFRPPLGWKSLALSGLFGLLVWFPYLRYESGRGFADLASLLLQRPVDAVWEANPAAPVYCYTAEPGENDAPDGTYLPYVGGPEIEARVIYPLAGWKNQAAYNACRLMLNIDRNFDGDLFLPGASPALGAFLWGFFMTAWMTLAWAAARAWKPIVRFLQIFAKGRRWIPVAIGAGGAAILYILGNPAVIEKFSADQSIDRNILLAVVQFREFAPWVWVSICAGLFFSEFLPDRSPDDVILFTAFSLPWIILLLLGEPGRPERFWYMWPLQVAIMVLFLYRMTEGIRRGRLVFWILTAALGLAMLPIPFIAEHLSNIRTNGYSGSDSDQWRVIEFLTEKAAAGEDRTIGVDYWLPGSGGADPLHPGTDFGDWFDYVLFSRYGVRNAGTECRGQISCAIWEVVDTNAGIPESLQGSTPEAVFGRYLIFRLP